MQNHVDVLVVGAGISGIAASVYLQQRCPERTFAILEGRDAIGGTWDLFRYPGIRSDSDMYTLGFSFRPWEGDVSIADGASILQYLKDTVSEYKLEEKIHYGKYVQCASWSSEDAKWTVTVHDKHTGKEVSWTCHFLYMCTGYYDYEEGYTPDFPDIGTFEGEVIHPQKWDESIDYKDKRIVIIGSGATAITLLPSLATQAKHVTMLQRSPTYVVSRPAKDPLGERLKAFLTRRTAGRLTRLKNILMSMFMYRISRRRPEKVKHFIIDKIREELPDFDVDTHFTPRYKPWDQRICLVPDSDLFEVIRDGKASVVTDHIETFTPDGILLQSGEELQADMIVTATGLKLKFMSHLHVEVDGKHIKAPETMTYKGAMFSDIPNLALASGYTNASWTLKCELVSMFVCRVLNTMKKKGYVQCTPRLHGGSVEEAPFMDLSSGYIQRAVHTFPKLGSRRPWRMHQNYVRDLFEFAFGTVEDGELEFLGPAGE